MVKNRIGNAYITFPASWAYVYEPYELIRIWYEGKPAIGYKCNKYCIMHNKIISVEKLSVLDEYFDYEYNRFELTNMRKINALYGK